MKLNTETDFDSGIHVKGVIADLGNSEDAEEVIEVALDTIAAVKFDSSAYVAAVENACLAALTKMGHEVATMSEALELYWRIREQT
jgi:hypothetical protein